MEKSNLKAIKQEGNALTKKVINVILDHGNTEEMENFIKDVLQHGCQSGIVGELIYYNDTVQFYNKYKNEINKLLKSTLDDIGLSSPSELFGDKWEQEDIFAEDTYNQNLLAWFGFEESVRLIDNELQLDY